MANLNNGKTKIKLLRIDSKDKAISNWQVQLGADQFHEDALSQYELFLGKSKHYFAGTIISHSEDELKLEYELPKDAVSLDKSMKKMPTLARLELIQSAFWLFQEQEQVMPFIHPQNMFVLGTQIKVMHRGFEDQIAPVSLDSDEKMKMLRALITYALNPKLDFATIYGGSKGVQNKFIQNLEKAESVEKIITLVQKQIKVLRQRKARSEVEISKKKYNLLRIVSAAAGTLTAGLAILAIVWGCFVLPKKQNIIDAQADYMNEDYSKAVSKLSSYKTKDLPKNANYVLACSYINLDNLSSDQKAAVLKTISPISDNNTLNYWIELGRGNYGEALSIAKNIGDSQYILHAYTKLYTQTKNDMQMNGSEKQKKLNSYRKSINYYLKKLGGEGNEFKGD